jgi:hypothetical protein
MKKEIYLIEMKKNPQENLQPLQVDPISGEYYLIIPEDIVNELSWYEDTEISFNLDGNEVILSEYKDD